MPQTANVLTSLLQEVAARRPIRHGVLAVERGDGSFRWSGAVGAADDSGRPMEAETPFFIASIDKLLNATIALALAEQGARRMPPVFGHSGSTGTWRFYCPERDLYLAGAVDDVTAGAVPYRLVPRLLRLLE